ncbi:MAG: sodium:proton antiporter [Bacteroidetes bacterium 4572_77]|nr:MAG: sodium:proton antiporter [Bacteroidetes bacterium 4572_77]
MIRTVLIYATLILMVIIFFPLLSEIKPLSQLNPLAKRYVEDSTKNLNSPNIVTSIVVTYRGLDTLGEVTVLFLATTGIGFLIKRRKKNGEKGAFQASEILQTGSLFLFPIIILFGTYIFLHGHLTPGGGFQGGVLIASASVLLIMANVNIKLNHTVLHFIESLSGFLYVIIGTIGLFLLGSFLDPKFLPLGKFGSLFSAGAIPIIYSLIGLKVGAELTNIVDSLRAEGMEDEK